MQDAVKKQKLEKEGKSKSKTSGKLKKSIRNTSDTETEDEWVESESSLDDVSWPGDFNMTEEEDKPRESNVELPYKNNDFVVVSFPGKKKYFKYLCMIQNIFEGGEIEALKSVSNDKRRFQIDKNDISVVTREQIIEILKTPLLYGVGEPLRYEFENSVNIDR